MRDIFFGVLASCLVSLPALAQDYSDTTPCSQMATAFNNDEQDQIIASGQYVENVFTTLDSIHVENGEPGVVAQWSDRGMSANVATVATWCQQHPKETVYNAAAEVYGGLRDLEIDLGMAK